jgi:hypothetical protein
MSPALPPLARNDPGACVVRYGMARRTSGQDELQYVEEKILQNFSNYSAWHFRTILLHQMYCGTGTADDGY